MGEPAEKTPARLAVLHLRTRRLRTLGMGLGMAPVLVVLHENDASALAWAWAVFCGLLWPHLAFLHASRSKDPFRAEMRNLVTDSAMAGSLAALMQFNLLPSVLLLAVTTADKLNVGVRGLWQRSVVSMVLGLLAVAILTGFSVRWTTSMPVLLASLPIMVIHTLAVGATSHRLIRKVQHQNLQLDELNRLDMLTGLESRRHWHEQAAGLLQHHAQSQQAATLLLVDVDHFKSINDTHGHAAGDDVLRGISAVIKSAIPPGSHAGRLGGDEFAVALPVGSVQAHAIAEASAPACKH